MLNTLCSTGLTPGDVFRETQSLGEEPGLCGPKV